MASSLKRHLSNEALEGKTSGIDRISDFVKRQ